MNAIWKFPLNSETSEIDAHVVEFLTVKIQDGRPCVWAIVDPNGVPRKYKVIILGTGWECNKIDASKYIGTVQDGESVWHCFWEDVPTCRSVNQPVFALFSSRPTKR